MRASGPQRLVDAARTAGVRDPRLLAALAEVPRARFVPAGAAAEAYLDAPIPIPHDQVTTQPSLVARMVEALELRGAERVLEVGAGYGFQSAILARLAGFVWCVERWPELAAAAERNLAAAGVANAEVVTGDGSVGLPAHEPYDAIVVSAAFPRVPRPLAAQLADGGRLVQPIGAGGAEEVVLFERRRGALRPRRTVTAAHFVRLRGHHGFGDGA